MRVPWRLNIKVTSRMQSDNRQLAADGLPASTNAVRTDMTVELK